VLRRGVAQHGVHWHRRHPRRRRHEPANRIVTITCRLSSWRCNSTKLSNRAGCRHHPISRLQHEHLKARTWLILALLSVRCVWGEAQTTDTPGPGFQRLGRIRPRAAKDIASSSWSSRRRDARPRFWDLCELQEVLGPLGAKAIRLQAGWAKCETEPGIYDFDWLDEVVNDSSRKACSRGWKFPTATSSILTAAAPAGGRTPEIAPGTHRLGQLVRAVVSRYRNRVNEWRSGMKPDLGPSPAEEYAEFFIRTAEVSPSRATQGADLRARPRPQWFPYAESFWRGSISAASWLSLMPFTVHSYPNNPDDTRNIDQLRAIIAEHGRPSRCARARQARPPSIRRNFALKKLPMTETIPGEWNLRRMLAITERTCRSICSR